MTNDELLAQIDASYEIERARTEAVRWLAIMMGDRACKDLWRLAWITGHRAGLQSAMDLAKS